LEAPSLMTACATALAAVFLVLAFLAFLIQLISLAFPQRAPDTDAALVAAIAGSVASLSHGARVTAIVEEP